jgi:competence ComEA-like helix-hairpin-helix protein
MEPEDLVHQIRNPTARKWAMGAVIAIGLVSAAAWFLQDVQYIAGELGPDRGSLIVNINTASERELQSIPGIGATRAAQIIASRPYDSVDDLERIAGIGGKTLESLRPFVTVEGETRRR